MTTATELIALYGFCHICGAPMNARQFELDEVDYKRGWNARFCTVEPLEHREDVRLLDEWEREQLRSVTA